jgi:hypothetical protein
VAALLVHVIVLLMVPVIVVAMPNVASAATKVSGTTRVEFGFKNFLWGQWASCSLQAFYVMSGDAEGANQSVKWNSAECETGPGKNLEGAALSLDFQGQTPNGDACSALSNSTIGADDDPVGGSLSFGVMPTGPEEHCTVTTLCWSIYQESWLPGDVETDEGGCVAVDMGVPAMPSGGGAECDLVTGVHMAGWLTPSAWYGPSLVDGHFRFNATARVGYDLEPGNWAWYWVGRKNGAVQTGWINNNIPLTRQGDALSGTGHFNGWQYAPPETALIGVGIVPWSRANGASVDELGSIPQTYPGRSAVGLNNPARCAFYFGEKIWNDSDSTLDEPAGPMGTGPEIPPAGDNDPDPDEDITPPPTPVEDEGCTEGFTIWNPITWGSAGFCEVVSALASAIKAIGRLATAVAGIPAAILKGLSGVLTSLFVPGEDYQMPMQAGKTEDALMTGGVGEWRGMWQSAPTYSGPSGGGSGEMGAMRVVAPDETNVGNGCAGPSFDLPEFMTEAGLPTTLRPLEACDGTMATLASWTRLIAMVLMGVTCLVKCMEMVTASVGVLRQNSLMASYDWSNEHTVIKR